MSEYAVTAIGRDRPGIVAAISGALFELGGNIADSRMAILGGHFAVMLIVDAPDEVGADRLGQRLGAVRDELELEALQVNEVAHLADSDHPTHLVSVYGADHPGIVHAVTTVLAERAVNVTDLQTRVAGSADAPLYVMLIEVALGDADVDALAAALQGAGERAEVDVTLREIGAEAL
jgi:glycine cleavage system transcriptional repressor